MTTKIPKHGNLGGNRTFRVVAISFFTSDTAGSENKTATRGETESFNRKTTFTAAVGRFPRSKINRCLTALRKKIIKLHGISTMKSRTSKSEK